jgi:hypothetical protein
MHARQSSANSGRKNGHNMAEKTVYRIYTEDVNRETVIDLVATKFGNFNVSTAKGYWSGVAEDSLIVEVITASASARETIKGIATKIRDYNRQETVLITSHVVNFELI